MDAKLSVRQFFVNRINFLMTKNKLSLNLQDRAKELSRLCGVSVQATRKWLEGETIPDYDKMLLISSTYSVTVSYLIGEIDDRNISPPDGKSQLKKSLGKGFIVELNEEQIKNTIIDGESVFCVPITESEKINGFIYLLKLGDSTIFRALSYDGKKLISVHEMNGIEQKDVYDDQKIIELLLSSVVARVKKVVKEEKQHVFK